MRLAKFFFLIFLFLCACKPSDIIPTEDKVITVMCEGDDTRGYLWTARVTPVASDNSAPICINVEHRSSLDVTVQQRTIYATLNGDHYFGLLWTYDTSCHNGIIKMSHCIISF
jgi:hypothetical protein